ncbi:hypothetical protein Tco_1451777, partial [Tanacetum coccineum]
LVSRAKVIENQIMAALIISISSNASDESVGSAPSRIILFGTIPAEIPTKTPVISPIAPWDSSNGPPYQDSYEVAVARYRSKVASCRSPSAGFPIAPINAPLGFRRRPTILIRPEQAIPFGQPFRTHPNGPRKVMTARKRVGPLPARRLAWKRVSPCSSDHHSSSGSSSYASPAHASGHPTQDQSISGYSSPATTIDDSPPPPRFVYPPIMNPRDSETYRYWRSVPLSTMC